MAERRCPVTDKACLSKPQAEHRARARRRRTDERITPYHCRHCGFWHFGHSIPKAKRRRSA